jgi:hypothetical protein
MFEYCYFCYLIIFQAIKTTKLNYDIFSFRIFNTDETRVLILPNLAKTTETKGKLRFLQTSETYEQITMMISISATRKIFIFLFIWRDKSINIESEEKLPPQIFISATSKGFMTGEIFAQ